MMAGFILVKIYPSIKFSLCLYITITAHHSKIVVRAMHLKYPNLENKAVFNLICNWIEISQIMDITMKC